MWNGVRASPSVSDAGPCQVCIGSPSRRSLRPPVGTRATMEKHRQIFSFAIFLIKFYTNELFRCPKQLFIIKLIVFTDFPFHLWYHRRARRVHDLGIRLFRDLADLLTKSLLAPFFFSFNIIYRLFPSKIFLPERTEGNWR